MADVTVDLFKFVTVRAAGTVAADDLRVIRDRRLGQPAGEGPLPDIHADGENYEESPGAKALYDLIVEHGAGGSSPQEVIEANQTIAGIVAADPNLTTETGLPHVDAVAAVLDDITANTAVDEIAANLTGRGRSPPRARRPGRSTSPVRPVEPAARASMRTSAPSSTGSTWRWSRSGSCR
jgi:hypothetical protein